MTRILGAEAKPRVRPAALPGLQGPRRLDLEQPQRLPIRTVQVALQAMQAVEFRTQRLDACAQRCHALLEARLEIADEVHGARLQRARTFEIAFERRRQRLLAEVGRRERRDLRYEPVQFVFERFGLPVARARALGDAALEFGAVSREAGAPYADRMFRLPAFLRDHDSLPVGEDLADGFALTGFFLQRHVLEPRGQMLADERMHFIAALARALPIVA